MPFSENLHSVIGFSRFHYRLSAVLKCNQRTYSLNFKYNLLIIPWTTTLNLISTMKSLRKNPSLTLLLVVTPRMRINFLSLEMMKTKNSLSLSDRKNAIFEKSTNNFRKILNERRS